MQEAWNDARDQSRGSRYLTFLSSAGNSSFQKSELPPFEVVVSQVLVDEISGGDSEDVEFVS